MRRGIVGVLLDRALEHGDCGFALSLGHAPEQRIGAHHHVPGIDILGRAALRAESLGLQQPRLDSGDDFLSDLVLKGENIAQVAIVSDRPRGDCRSWRQSIER